MSWSTLRRRALSVAAVLLASCHAGSEPDDIASTVRITPASLSSSGAWGLFDRSLESGFVPDATTIRASLDHQEQLTAIKVFGSSPYRLRVTGAEGSPIGFPATDLSKLSTGWHIIPTTSLVSADSVELHFESLGAPAKVPEIELWAVDEEPTGKVDIASSDLPRGFVTLAPATRSQDLTPTDCAAFPFELTRAPTSFRKLHLVFDAEGLFRSFSLQRSINGLAEQGGRWLAGDSTKRTFAEEVDPAVVHLGHNEVRMCLPADATRGVSITNLHLVGELDRGKALVSAASIGERARDGAALLDSDAVTSLDVAAGEQVILAFDRLTAPDAIELAGRGFGASSAPSVTCTPVKGDAVVVGAKVRASGGSLLLELDAAANRCAALSLTFSTAVSLSAVDVIGSGAGEPVDWPRLVVTSPREHFGDAAWVGGFVARPTIMSGAIRVDVSDGRETAMTGDFGRLVTRTGDGASVWPVDVKATLPDGSVQTKTVLLDHDLRSQLATAKATAVNTAKAALDTRFGQEGDSVVGRARMLEAISVRLGTSVGVDVPIGAVKQDTKVAVRHLGEDILPPLDPGMINVTAPKGHGFEFLPHGQKFARDVEVVVPYDSTLIPEEMKPEDVNTYFYDPQAQHWKKLERNAIDVGQKVIRSRTNHFTIMIDAVLTVPKNSSPLSFDPTALTSIAAASPAANIDFMEPPSANSTGDARMSLPVRIPSGRGAYTPSLAISYSSSGGNSWLGVGFDVSISRIEIDTRWGVPTYAPSEEPRYLLDGAELVPTLDQDGPGCQDGGVGRRYHARIEGAFTHILRCDHSTPGQLGPAHYGWELHDRSGTLFVYGVETAGDPNADSNPAALVDPEEPHGIFRWYLRKVVDVHGNTTLFQYQKREDTGAQLGREVYPARIEYTAHQNLAAAYSVEFELDNGQRPDRIISARPGFKNTTAHLLREIRVLFGSGLIRQYVLTYDHGDFDKTVLKQVDVYGTGGCAASGDAFSAPTCGGLFHRHTFDYYREDHGFDDPVEWRVEDDPDPTNGALTKGSSQGTTGDVGMSAGLPNGLSASGSYSVSSSERDEFLGLYDVDSDGLVDQVFDTGAGLRVLYNQSRAGLQPSADPLFKATPAHIDGITDLGREKSLTLGWSGGVSLGTVVGTSRNVGISYSTSRAKRLLTDLNGDSYIDLVDTEGTPMVGEPCPQGTCFTPASFGATDSITPRTDPLLKNFDVQLKAQSVVADPVVQWVAPFDGKVVISGTVQRRAVGGVDGVSLEIYHEDTFLTGEELTPENISSVTFPNDLEVDVHAGEALYLRVRTGIDDGIADDGTLRDFVDTDLQVTYKDACTEVGCGTVTNAFMLRQPTGTPVLAFDSRDEFRIAGTPTAAVATAQGTIELQASLVKHPSIADVRVCVQRFASLVATNDVSIDQSCDASSANVTNISGTIALAAETDVVQPLAYSIPVELGQYIVVRVESDLLFDPSSISLAQLSATTPFLSYSQACIPRTDATGVDCTTDPTELANVVVPTQAFGPFIALPNEPPHVPYVASADGTLHVNDFSAPSDPFVFAARSDRQGLIFVQDCKLTSCGSEISVPAFQVAAGESITFELVTNTASSNSSLEIYVDDPGNLESAPLVHRAFVTTPETTVFAGGYHQWRAGFWNDQVTFAPAQLLSDVRTPSQWDSLGQARVDEIARSFIPPLPSFAGTALTGSAPAWIGSTSESFITAAGMHAGYLGLVDPSFPDADPKTVGGLYEPHYARLTGSLAFYVGGGFTLFNLATVDLKVGGSTTNTTTDVVDMNGDGIADVITPDGATFGAMNAATAGAGHGAFDPNGEYRHRGGHEYSFGFGGKPVWRKTTSGGRTLDIGNYSGPDKGFLGLSGGLGVSIGRSQTSKDLSDVNGDGLPDLVRRSGTVITVQYNLGRRFGREELFGTVQPELTAAADGFESSVEDLNVPGDLLNSTSNALNHETSITQTESGGFSFKIGDLGVDFSHSRNQSATRVTRQLSDINGDGLPDLLLKRDGENVIRVQLNRGASFGPASTWATQSWPVDLNSPFVTRVTNLGVSGPDVLGATGSDHSNSTSASVGIPIVPGIVTLNLGGGVSHNNDSYELSLVDIDGDGAADHVLRKHQSLDQGLVWVKRNKVTGRANLLAAVHRPLGGTITLDYTRTGNTVAMPHSRQVLTTVTVDDGVELPDFPSPNLITDLAYEGGVYDRHEKEFLGFSKVRTTRQDGVAVEDEFDTSSFTRHGLLTRETRLDHNGTMFRRQVITREVRPIVDDHGDAIAGDPSCVASLHALLATLGEEACTPRFPVTVEEDEIRSEDGAITKTHVVKDLIHDRFGNILASLDQGDDAAADDDVYAAATYDNAVSSTSWILGKPQTLVARSGSAMGALLRSRTGDYNTLGDLTAVHVQTSATGDSTTIATTELGYDGFGNLVHVTTPPNESGHPQTFDGAFDSQTATYPIRTTNGFGHVSTAEYDLRFGVATREIDINGSSLTRTLDGFGRLIQVRGPYDVTTPALEFAYFPDYLPGGSYPHAVTTTHTSPPEGYTGPLAPDIKTVTFADGLDRAIEVRKTAVKGGQLGMTTTGLSALDPTGRVVKTQNPFFSDGPSEAFVTKVELGTTTAYDDQDRAVLVAYPDNASESTSFAIEPSPDGPLLFKTRHVDPNGHARETYVDHQGRTRVFVEHPKADESSVTRYAYQATGELRRIVDAEGNQTTLTYDLRGLRTELNNPDTGRIEDRFDLMGNRIAAIEPNLRALGVQVHYIYDLDRLSQIDYPSKPDVTFLYGTTTDTALRQVGRIKHIDDESGSRDFEYGRMGETTRTIRTVKPDLNGSQSSIFDVRTTSDSLGRMLRIAYPDGVVVTNSFDDAGNLKAVTGAGAGWTRTYATGIEYDVFGNRTRLEYGNHVVSTWKFDEARARLEHVTTTLPDSAHTLIQNLGYDYDAASNPKTVTNALAALSGGSGNQPGKSTLALEYDGADRLTHAHGLADLSAQKTTTYDELFAYSPSHNLLHKERAHLITQPGGIPAAPSDTNFASDYLYDAARPHMPRQVGDLEVTYDASGNPTMRRKSTTSSVQNLVWDDDNRMVDFTSGGVHQHNTFDSSGSRVRRKSTQSETLFSSQYFDLENGTQGVRHVFAGEARVASELVKFTSGTAPTAPAKPGTAYFFHLDRLGSTSVLTAEDASVHESLEYFADGEEWIDRAPQKPWNHYLFSGKPFDPDTGFYDYGLRFYDSRLSLWLGADSAFKNEPGKAVQSPHQLAVVAYARQNPIVFTDPDGADVSLGGMAYSCGAPACKNAGPEIQVLRGVLAAKANETDAVLHPDRVVTGQASRFAKAYEEGGGGLRGAFNVLKETQDFQDTAGSAKGLVQGLQQGDLEKAVQHTIEIGGTLVGAISAFSGPKGGKVTVTSWAEKGITPDLNPGRWVMLGKATRLNYLLSGLAGPKAFWQGLRSFPRLFKFRASNVPPSNFITGAVDVPQLRWPPGIESWKGVLGQRVIAEKPGAPLLPPGTVAGAHPGGQDE